MNLRLRVVYCEGKPWVVMGPDRWGVTLEWAEWVDGREHHRIKPFVQERDVTPLRKEAGA